MATSTPNYGLYKYEGNDAPDLTKLSTSMDKIDTELKKNETNIGLLNETPLSDVNILEWARSLTSKKTTAFSTMGTTTGLPEGIQWQVTTGLVQWRYSLPQVIIFGAFGDLAINRYQASGWAGWYVNGNKV